MHARFLRPRRPPLLAAGLATLIALSACSEEAAEATQGQQNAAKTSVEQEAEKPAMQGQAGPTVDQFAKDAANRKPVDDPKADAARKEAYAKNKRDAAGGAIDRDQYKQEMQTLSAAFAGGKITKAEYEDAKYKLEQRMRGVAEQPKAIDPDGAKLVFAHKEFDFGTVWDTQVLEHEFAFENQGGKTLEITRVKPSCGCTTTSLSRTTFEPGQGEMIPVVWKPKGTGPQKKTVTISHNNGPDQILNISATLKQFVALEPSLLRLGDLPQHEEHHAELKLILADPKFQITRITPSNNYLKASEKSRDADGNLIIDVVIKENAPWGNFNARLEIEGTGVTEPGTEPVTHTVMTQVIAKMYGDIRIEPDQIQLGVVAQNSKFQGEAILYHVDGTEFDLAELSMRFSRPEMQVRSEATTKDGKPAVKIIVEGDTTGFAEKYVRGTIFFKTSLGDADNQQLQIAGSVR
jgi:Protein of unknown function (DUF1573)